MYGHIRLDIERSLGHSCTVNHGVYTAKGSQYLFYETGMATFICQVGGNNNCLCTFLLAGLLYFLQSFFIAGSKNKSCTTLCCLDRHFTTNAG